MTAKFKFWEHSVIIIGTDAQAVRRKMRSRRIHTVEGRATGTRTNPKINVIVYHRGNVIPDREDKWRQNTIRCTAVGRSRWGVFSFHVFTYSDERRSLGRGSVLLRSRGVIAQRGSRRRKRDACVTNSVTSMKDGRWLVSWKTNRIGFWIHR